MASSRPTTKGHWVNERLDKAGNRVHAGDMTQRQWRPEHNGVFLRLAWLVFIFAATFKGCQAWGDASVEANFSTYRYPQEDLGAVYTPQETTLKVWAPTATGMGVELFNNPTNAMVTNTPMIRDPNGIWSLTLPGNQDGHYYRYQVTLPGVSGGAPKVVQVNDPYAHGTSANRGRTLIYDPVKTNPEGWEQDQFVRLPHNVDAVLYEVHVRDFSIDPHSGIVQRGKFLGMVEPETKTGGGEKTGIDHLAELGITHVHLLPVNDYASGDERQPADQYTWYDWGYDPVLYSSPEGSYASNADGTARQREFKQMVQAFHQRQIGVVLDVVFNHTAQTGSGRFSVFDKLYPGYYYRTDAAGRPANATGCGNEFASERPMARKLIVDTIKYWLREYHVDGFRFDLMGILDRTTMLEVYHEAKQINPDVIIYGEGWDMEQVLPRSMMMTQGNLRGTGLAAFNDSLRDNIKGDAGNGPARGFVQGAGAPYGGLARFWLNIKGQSTGRGDRSIPVASPNETINYDSVHDDLCLWDKLQVSTPEAPENVRIQMDKLAAGIVLTSQGVPFLQGGDEFLRSKHLVSNSYNDNDPRVNPINWLLKAAHRDVFDYYRGLIALRKAHPAFRLTTRTAVDQAMELATNTPENLVEYVIRHHANQDRWGNILVIYNGAGQAREVAVSGDWSIVADDRRAGVEELQRVKDRVLVEPYSLVVAHTEGDWHF